MPSHQLCAEGHTWNKSPPNRAYLFISRFQLGRLFGIIMRHPVEMADHLSSRGVESRGFRAGRSTLSEVGEYFKLFTSGSVQLSRVSRMGAILLTLIFLPACTTINFTGDETLKGLSRAQKEMRHQAAMLSKTVWQGVKNPSFLASITDLLLNGREPEGPGLIADVESARRSAAVAYIQEKEQAYGSANDQLLAMIADVRMKTSQVQAFVQVTELVVDRHRADLNGPFRGGRLASADVVRGLARVQDDYRIVERSIESVREQRATFETVQLTYLEKNPTTDMMTLDIELRSFESEINRMVALSDQLSSLDKLG